MASRYVDISHAAYVIYPRSGTAASINVREPRDQLIGAGILPYINGRSFLPTYHLTMGATPSKEYIVATDADEKNAVLVHRQDAASYDNLLSILQKQFPGIPKESMIIQTKELDVCAGRYVNIPDDLWPAVSCRVDNIKVISRPTETSVVPVSSSSHSVWEYELPHS
ncbi:hypothetical protein DFS33DRAFT_172247 [Desarmillaria ectypa]|nr:hypothetical protein DFS33DRAFT_172247 [Desarmillaria ectypa]